MEKLKISPSPHVWGGRKGGSTRSVMRDVLIALIPALAVSTWVYGLDVLVITGISVASCAFFEWFISRYLTPGRVSTAGDLSCIVTGVLLAFNLPVSLPLWMVVLGALVAVGVAKMSFGGLGKNPFNPALVGRVFLLLSFPVAMTTFPGVDGSTGATPLGLIKAALKAHAAPPELDHLSLFVGNHAGSLGEIAVGALLLGFVYLLIRRVITWQIPVVILATMFVFTGILHAVQPTEHIMPFVHLLTGGAVLGAVFMATDYSSSPMNRGAMVVYAFGIGLITVLIRVWGSYPEGMSFAILIMNAMVPLLDKWLRPKLFGKR